MDQTDHPESSLPRRTPVDAVLVAALLRGDDEAWRNFLIDHHAVFERSLRLAIHRAGARLDAEDPTLLDDAKVYFYEALRRGFRSFQGEGQFFAFLHRTVKNFVFEKRRGRAIDRAARSAVDADAEDGPLDDLAAAAWAGQRRAELDPALSAKLDECVLRLPGLYRSVVLMRHYEMIDEPLQALAAVFNATVEAIQKRYQRGMALLRECMAGWREA